MSKNEDKSSSLRAYVKRLQNPYASLQVTEDTDLPDANRQITVSPGQQAGDSKPDEKGHKTSGMVWLLQNPYATLYYNESEDVSPDHAPLNPVIPRVATLSKQAFRNGCRRIFRQYIPSLEGKQLRDHHRDFINRNESRSPEARHLILAKLQKYDISNIPGLTTHFNRERDQLTEAKLREIERSARVQDKSH